MSALAKLGIMVALGVAGFPAASRGQSPVPNPAPAASSGPLEALNGVKTAKTGRVATAVLHPDVSVIAVEVIPSGPPELLVTAAAAEALTARSMERVDNHMLDGEIAAMVTSLGHCRLEVARRKRVPPSRIAPGGMALRWTVLGGGQVAAMDVINGSPVDADVLDCIRRDAKRWRFTPAPGGDLRLQRALVFRFATAAAVRP